MSFVNITPMAHPHASGLGFPPTAQTEGRRRWAARGRRAGRSDRATLWPRRACCCSCPGARSRWASRRVCVASWARGPGPGRGPRTAAGSRDSSSCRTGRSRAPRPGFRSRSGAGPRRAGRVAAGAAWGRDEKPGAGPAAPTRPLPRRAASPFLKARPASEALTLAAPSHQRPPFCPFAALDQQPRPPGTELPTSRGVDLGVAIILQSSDQTVLLTRRTRTLRVSPNLWVPPGELPEDLAPSPGVNVPFTERYSQSQDRKIGPEMWPVA